MTSISFGQGVLRALTLACAGLAAVIFPVTLFAIQGMSRIGLEEVVFMLSLYLVHPTSIALIFLVCFKKIAPGRPIRMATGFVGFNALCLLAMSALIRAEVFSGDSWLPLVFAVPSFLFLLDSYIGVLVHARRGGQT